MSSTAEERGNGGEDLVFGQGGRGDLAFAGGATPGRFLRVTTFSLSWPAAYMSALPFEVPESAPIW